MFATISRIVLTLLTLAVATGSHCRAQADEIPWSTDIEGSLKKAAASGKPVLMEFTAPWCGYCKKMEKTTFVDPAVVSTVNRSFVAVRVDADQNKALVTDLAIKGLPAILVVSPDLQILERISGFQTPDVLIRRLNQVTSRSQQPANTPMVASGKPPAQPVANNPPRQRDELKFEAISQEEAPMAKRPSNVRPVSQPNKPAPRLANQQPERPAPASKDRVEAQGDEFFAAINNQPAEHSRPASNSQPVSDGSEDDQQPSFNGSCLVSAVEGREIISGNAHYQMNYRGHLLYFSSEEAKDKFQAQPGTFWPMLDGACAMTLLDEEKKVEGDLQYAAVYRKRIWLFTSEQNMRDFLRDPADAVEDVLESTSAGGR